MEPPWTVNHLLKLPEGGCERSNPPLGAALMVSDSKVPVLVRCVLGIKKTTKKTWATMQACYVQKWSTKAHTKEVKQIRRAAISGWDCLLLAFIHP